MIKSFVGRTIKKKMKVFVTVYDGDVCLGKTWLNNCTEEAETKCELCEESLGWSFPLCDKHLAQTLGIEIKPSQVHGLGLFTLVERKRGDPLCPLAGEIRSEAQLNALYSYTHNPECVAPYCMRIASKRIDAFRLRYAWVFANHSRDSNCKIKSDGLYATRFIKAGEELLLNYGQDYRFHTSLRFEYKLFAGSETSIADKPGIKLSAAEDENQSKEGRLG